MASTACPFQIGQVVYYRPTVHGHGWDQAGMPHIGAAVKIADIVKGVYLELEHWPHPGGATYWTEFSAD